MVDPDHWSMHDLKKWLREVLISFCYTLMTRGIFIMSLQSHGIVL
jgi:hypothetical protein